MAKSLPGSHSPVGLERVAPVLEAAAEVVAGAERPPGAAQHDHLHAGVAVASPTAASTSSGIGGTIVLSRSGRFSVIVATGAVDGVEDRLEVRHGRDLTAPTPHRRDGRATGPLSQAAAARASRRAPATAGPRSARSRSGELLDAVEPLAQRVRVDVERARRRGDAAAVARYCSSVATSCEPRRAVVLDEPLDRLAVRSCGASSSGSRTRYL